MCAVVVKYLHTLIVGMNVMVIWFFLLISFVLLPVWNYCTTSIFDGFEKKDWVWILLNRHRVKTMHTGSNLYVYTHFLIF